MKSTLYRLVSGVMICIALLMSSCYSHTFTIGKAREVKKEEVVTGYNHFIVYGLIPLATSEPQKMAKGAKNYEVTEKWSFVTFLVATLTFGLYVPTVTEVQK